LKGREVLAKMVQIRRLIRPTTGMDLSWISMFPGEAERLLPPLTFMNPPAPEKSQVIDVDGFKLTVVEIQVSAPPM
jgi:hypothetical protein